MMANRDSQHFDRLLSMTRAWDLELTLQDLLDRVTREAAEMFGFDRTTILLLEKKGITRRSSWVKPGLNPTQGDNRAVRNAALQVIRTGRPVFGHRLEEAGNLPPEGFAGPLACVPLTASRGILGALFLDAFEPDRQITTHDQEILETLGRQAALSIQHALLYHSAITDPLTSLFSHRHFQREVEQAVRHAARSSRPVSLLIMDLDYFKEINDTHGHEVGNDCIIRFSELLRDTMRASDIIARFGGDEFEVLLPDTSGEGALKAAEKIRAAVEATEFPVAGKLTATIGIACFPENSDGAQGLFLSADEALYEGKLQRNCSFLSTVRGGDIPLSRKKRGQDNKHMYSPPLPLADGIKDDEPEPMLPMDELPDLDRVSSGTDQVDGHPVLDHLGQGSVGEVLLVRQPELDRDVALKRPLASSLTPEQEAQFEQEAKVTASLKHPGVIAIYDMGRDMDGRRYYTMKPLDGESLASILENRRRGKGQALHAFSVNRLVEVLQRTAETLAYAHSREVAHLDMKPANIMVGEFGEVTIIDWGMSVTQADKPEEVQAEKMQYILGDPNYRAPEFLAAGITPGTASDVYTLGILLYEVMTGVRPFERETLKETMHAIRTGAVIAPDLLMPEAGIPPSLAGITMQAMETDPARRPTALEFADALSRFLRREREWDIIRFGQEGHLLTRKDWHLLRGAITLKDGILSGRDSGETIALFKTPANGNYRFIAEAWIDTQSEIALIGSGPNPDTEGNRQYAGYCFEFGAENGTCTKLAREGEDILARTDLNPEPGRKYRIEISYEDGWLHCYIDDEIVFRYRELSPLISQYFGIYFFGRGAHIRPLEIHREVWGLTVPAIQVADDLFRHESYEAALERYQAIANANPERLEGLEAHLKACRTLIHLERYSEAFKGFRILYGTVLEPFALAEEAHWHWYRLPASKPAKGIQQLKKLLEEFPLSQAKGRLLEIARLWTSYEQYVLDGMPAHASNALKLQLFNLAKRTYDPPSQSQIRYMRFEASYCFGAGKWKEALDGLLAFKERLHTDQISLDNFFPTVVTAMLACGRDDLLPDSAFEMDGWEPAATYTLSMGVALHVIVRKEGLAAFLKRALRMKKPGRERTFGHFSRAILGAHLAAGDLDKANVYYAREIYPRVKAVTSPSSTSYYMTGLMLVQARMTDALEKWAKLGPILGPRSEDNAATYQAVIGLLRAWWEIQWGSLKKAAGYLKQLGRPRLSTSVRGFDREVLQTMCISLGLLKPADAPDLKERQAAYLDGTELDLVRIFEGKKKPRPGKLWPHPLFRPDLRFLLARWLEEKKQYKEALKIIRPCVDERYGLTNCQPSIQAMLARLEKQTGKQAKPKSQKPNDK